MCPIPLKINPDSSPNSRPHTPAVNLMSKYKLKPQGMWAGLELSPTYKMQFPFVFLIFLREFWLLQQSWVGSISEEPSSVGNVIGKRSLWGRNGPLKASKIGHEACKTGAVFCKLIHFWNSFSSSQFLLANSFRKPLCLSGRMHALGAIAEMMWVLGGHGDRTRKGKGQLVCPDSVWCWRRLVLA